MPVEAAAPLIDLVGSADKDELRLQAGHIGLAVGKTAAKVTIPTIIEFLQKRSEKLPEVADGGARMTASVEAPVLHELSPDQVDALADFFAALPEGDRTFVKEAVDDRAVVAGWADQGSSAEPLGRLRRRPTSSATSPSCRCRAGRATSVSCGSWSPRRPAAGARTACSPSTR